MTTANGATSARAARKSLGDQIDRLDGILDGLAEALNGSVADAVRDVIGQAVSQAVHAAVTEVLASPDLLRAALEGHAPASASPASPAPRPEPRPEPPTLKEHAARIGGGLCGKVKRAAGLAAVKLSAACAAARDAGKKAVRLAANAPAILGAVARAAWAFRKPCAIAVGVGVACAATCYLGGLLLSSMANGVGGTAITLSALTLPLKRLFWDGDR